MTRPRGVGAHLRRAGRLGTRAALVVAGLVLLDSLLGLGYRTDTVARLHVTAERGADPGQVLVVFPGFAMPGDLLSDAFRPHLGDNDAMVVVQYAQRGVDIDDVYARVKARLRDLHARSLRVYGASMGGLCARDFLLRYVRDGSPFGPAVLVLDTSPHTTAEVRAPAPLFAVAAAYRGGPLSSLAYPVANRFARYPPAEPDADAGTIARAHHAGSWAGMPALTSQAEYLYRAPAGQPGDLVGVAARVVYLRGRPPGEDPRIDVEAAITRWRQAYPDLVVIPIPGREMTWHVPIIERPRETMAAILSAASEDPHP